MSTLVALQGFGPLASPPALLVWVAVLLLVLLVGRVVLAVAWRVLLLVLAVLIVLWLLSLLGFRTGVFGSLVLP